MRHIRRRYPAVAALALAAIVAGCSENLPSDPTQFDSHLALRNWSDTLVLGEQRHVTVGVLDDADHEVLGRTIEWTNATPAALTIALAPGSSAGAGASATGVASTDSIDVRGVGTGTSDVTFHFADALFHQTELTKTVTVVAAGVRLLTGSDTTLSAIGDTVRLIGSALGRDTTDGVTLVPVSNQGLTWSRQGAGAVNLLGEGDTVRVVSVHEGTDTIVATHPRCLLGAQCTDTVIVMVSMAPSPGGDIVVLTDVDVWSTEPGANGNAPENQTLGGNMVSFTGGQPRMSGHTVMFYTGSASRCSSVCASIYADALSAKLTSLNYTIVGETSSLATIPSDVKVVFLFLPTAALGKTDVNGLKQFASEGGRVVLMSDNDNWLPWWAFPAQNQLLSDLGASMTINPTCAGYGYGPTEGTHQVTAGVSQIYVACGSTITTGPGAYPLLRDAPNEQLMGAVAKIDVTPLP